MPKRLCCRMVQVVSFCLGWEGNWVRLVFCWWGSQRASPGLDGRELHAGSIVARGKGVAGGKAGVFNEKLRNVGVTGAAVEPDGYMVSRALPRCDTWSGRPSATTLAILGIGMAVGGQCVSKNWGLRILSRVSPAGFPLCGRTTCWWRRWGIRWVRPLALS